MNRRPCFLRARIETAFAPLALALMASLAASGCATKAVRSDQDPADLLAQACKPGASITRARGSVWLKAKSKEASGQFPANVKAAPESLELEVTNLLGGTEAFIQVKGREYEIRVPGKSKKDKARVEKGKNSWGGIPLRWADALFLGRIPCPNAAQLKEAKLVIEENGQLTVETPASLDYEAERFVYRFRKWAGSPWAESLHWERKGTSPLAVRFSFDQPDDKTGSPLKWEAESDQGEVKIRWKDHDFETKAK